MPSQLASFVPHPRGPGFSSRLVRGAAPGSLARGPGGGGAAGPRGHFPRSGASQARARRAARGSARRTPSSPAGGAPRPPRPTPRPPAAARTAPSPAAAAAAAAAARRPAPARRRRRRRAERPGPRRRRQSAGPSDELPRSGGPAAAAGAGGRGRPGRGRLKGRVANSSGSDKSISSSPGAAPYKALGAGRRACARRPRGGQSGRLGERRRRLRGGPRLERPAAHSKRSRAGRRRRRRPGGQSRLEVPGECAPAAGACGIFVSGPGIEPAPPTVEARCLNPWTAREVVLVSSECPLVSPSLALLWDVWLLLW
ncbi:translation initiation factor IF-2-like [Cervus canadensis]|uniref:translation initiation factor IF-2-like n=1 Tax=Cervus canadensis TaxID=1574408 RepID=UPI001C9E7C71|nr:translation initiation factor IF-2-like [Cervus canadensis]